VIGAAVDIGSQHLHVAVRRVTRGASEETDDTLTTLTYDALADSRTVDDAVRHYLSESGSSDLRSPVVRSANRAIGLRVTARGDRRHRDAAAAGAIPTAREVLDMHAEAVAERLAGVSDKSWPPISDESVVALRAESSSDEAAINAALPLVMVAATLAELELMYPSPGHGRRGASFIQDRRWALGQRQIHEHQVAGALPRAVGTQTLPPAGTGSRWSISPPRPRVTAQTGQRVRLLPRAAQPAPQQPTDIADTASHVLTAACQSDPAL
jgi:hypothetical protein